eukprot:TCONS_00030053-protein
MNAKKQAKSCQHCDAPLNINACQKCPNCGKKQNKRCQNCQMPMTSNAAKSCNKCGHEQQKTLLSLDDSISDGTIDRCAKKRSIRKNCHALNKKLHDQCIVLYLSGQDRIHVDSYATEGFASYFMKELSIQGQLFGDVIKDTFKTAFKEYLKSRLPKEANPSQSPTSESVPPTLADDFVQISPSTNEEIAENTTSLHVDNQT